MCEQRDKLSDKLLKVTKEEIVEQLQQKELELGEKSVIVNDFNPKKHLQDLHQKHLKQQA